MRSPSSIFGDRGAKVRRAQAASPSILPARQHKRTGEPPEAITWATFYKPARAQEFSNDKHTRAQHSLRTVPSGRSRTPLASVWPRGRLASHHSKVATEEGFDALLHVDAVGGRARQMALVGEEQQLVLLARARQCRDEPR
eukprot:7312323-Prymnesium_polylepis.1